MLNKEEKDSEFCQLPRKYLVVCQKKREKNNKVLIQKSLLITNHKNKVQPY